jgi:lysophospholipid acyltransferase (LPLAT)-like uncharacterized protein
VIRSRVGVALTIALGGALIRALGSTWRFRSVNHAPYRDLVTRRESFILACWHGEMLAPIYFHRRDGLTPIVSEHRDGEIIAKIIEGLGFETIRGSTTRGASRALLGVIRKLESGARVAFTPDGPRGPRHVLQPGLLAAAQRAKVPIIFLGTHISRFWEFRSWDRFQLAKPFARVTIAFSDPTFVDPAIRDVTTEVGRFTALITTTVEAAQRAATNG